MFDSTKALRIAIPAVLAVGVASAVVFGRARERRTTTIPAETMLVAALDHEVSTAHARPGDDVELHTTAPLRLGDAEIPADELKKLVADFKRIAERQSGEPFPTDVYQQLSKAIEAVFSSWNNKRAIDYRNFNKIPHDLGTAVNVQSMVFGNMGNDSGTGVAFTRDPGTGEKELYGEYLLNAQGEDVVAGIRTPSKISRLQQDLGMAFEFTGEQKNIGATHFVAQFGL